MFAYLIGRIADISEDNLVLEVNNIGFNVKIPSGIHGLLPGLGEEVKIHTYTCVREDSFQLYGFLTRMIWTCSVSSSQSMVSVQRAGWLSCLF